jgi:hypothetical protein
MTVTIKFLCDGISGQAYLGDEHYASSNFNLDEKV